MKRIIYICVLVLTVGFYSCSDDLDTVPTDKTSTTEVFSSVDGALAAMNGVYRSLYFSDDFWSTSYGTENFGLASVNIAADLMGEDMGMGAPGSAWFWYDYRLWTRTEINNTSDRPYVWWYMFYNTINNVNNIIAYAPEAEGGVADRNNVLGQAFAMRAFAYFNLIQLYQRTYIGNEDAPGVPLYTEPSSKETVGKDRGTVEAVYKQINDDLDSALVFFEDASENLALKSHINKYVAHGIKSRVALVQNKWEDAAEHANSAREGYSLMGAGDLLGGFNSVGNSEWMWGAEINEDQSTSWYSFFNHMDADAGGHAATAWKIVGNWLYDQIGADDVRKGWFKGEIPEDEAFPADGTTESDRSYNQLKFRVKSVGSWASDYLYMRAAEMYLNEAEALCALEKYAEAREVLLELLSYKDPAYQFRLDAVVDDKELTIGSTGDVTTLMDEIIVQRRIELWGEGRRLFDIQRLKTGFYRDWDESNHPVKTSIRDADSWEFVMMIPQKEFDGNPNMDPSDDQNP